VRINPYELHIEDTDYYDGLYSRTLRLDKYEYGAGRFGNSTLVFTTSGHDIHAHRRAPLSPMFSKQAIVNFQTVIREKLKILCEHIAKYKKSGGVFNVLEACAAFAGDVITEYAFGIGYDHLDLPGFRGSFHDAYMAMSEFSHVAVMFPWIHTVGSSYIRPV
jgi:cytochrome P450